MLILGFVLAVTAVAAVAAVQAIAPDFANAWRRAVRRPEMAAVAIFLAVALIDIAYTVRLPEWLYTTHQLLDEVLLLLPLFPASAWLLSLTVAESTRIVAPWKLWLLAVTNLVWAGFSVWWLTWTLAIGGELTVQDYIGVLEGVLPALGLPLVAWRLIRRIRRRNTAA